MKILVAHNQYQHRGGEDSVVENEVAMLSEAGHQVEFLRVSNDQIAGTSAKMSAALNLVSNKTVPELRDTIERFHPDVVHFHNVFPILTVGALLVPLQRGIPVVQTLHNFRVICAGGLLLRDGRPCEDCVGNSRWSGIRHRCYRNSMVGSASVAQFGIAFRRAYDTYPQLVTVIALSEFMKTRLVADGYDAARIVVKGNSTTDEGHGPEVRDGRVVFVGRLSPEKGPASILRLARRLPDVTFELVGSGPQFDELSRLASNNVVMSGRQDHSTVLDRIRRASVVVIPSECYEGFPMALVESFAAATPVLASRIGSLAELISHGHTGFTAPVEDDAAWEQVLRRLLNDPHEARAIGEAGRTEYEAKYTQEKNLERLSEIYERAIVNTRPSVMQRS